ncbi:type IV secretion system DNA-binding domain-containing protein [Francisella uliginis]|uniref:Helicase HerA central domain-containing protein n=1 Tax=Francisella uliginis TaxID=573570 RepID=A0A1L4BS43_9GAMM|nr:type IV secretion system DNA-binding domain-containing protein [Francisella uliginis]API86661.1 hypothetical protein F7310_04485 [Francisella uliginis]
MKNQKTYTNKNSINIQLLPFMLILLPVISAIVILISARSPNLQGLFAILERISGGFGFHTDYGWLWRAVLFFPFLSVAYYIGYTMLKSQQQTFGVQALRLSIKTLFIFVFSCFLIGVSWAIAVYVSKVMSFMSFYGNIFDRVATLTNQYPYMKAYSLLEDYIWANLVYFYITLAIVAVVHIVLSRTVYPSKIEPAFSDYISSIASNNKRSEGLTSSKDELLELKQRLSKMKTFDPATFFKKDRIFIAKDIENNKPIYIEDSKIKNRELKHVCIVGSSGSGKGVFTQYFLAQACIKNNPIIVLDCNDDEHVMKNLKHTAENMGKDFHWIDFKQYNKPQLDLLQGATPHQFKELTNTLFPTLKITEGGANYFSQFSRRARTVYESEVEGVRCMFDLHTKVLSKYGEDRFKNDDGHMPQFIQEFFDFANIPMFKVNESMSIAEAIKNGDVIYISCPDMSADDEITYLCKALLIRILQIISSRNIDNSNHVFLFVDEFADFVNKTVKAAIEKIRKKRCTMVMNMTSFESLAGLQSDVDGNSVIDTVKINSIKLIYEQPHESISEKASKMTGEKIIKVERNHIKRNEALKEIDQVMETVQTSQKTNVFSATMLANLPPKVGVLVGHGLPRLVQTEILKYPPNVEYPTLIQAEPYNANDSETDSEDDNDIMGAL